MADKCAHCGGSGSSTKLCCNRAMGHKGGISTTCNVKCCACDGKGYHESPSSYNG